MSNIRETLLYLFTPENRPLLLWERTKEDWLSIYHKVNHGHRLCEDPDQYTQSHRFMRRAVNKGLFDCYSQQGDFHILDVGCGNGFEAIALTELENVKYVGFDPIKTSVDFCQETFEQWSSRFQFYWIDAWNEMYNPLGKVNPMDVKFPADNEYDVVMFWSVFTHLCNQETAIHNLQECFRVLKPNGRAWTTWFSSPPNATTERPERTVYNWRAIIDIILNTGFKIVSSELGLTTNTHDQWALVLEK